jgi:hypothetical protein
MNRMYCWLTVVTGVAVLGLASPAVGQTPLLELEKSDATKVMQVDENGGLVVLGASGIGAIPVAGAGVRLLWWPGRGAFRAGGVSGSQWDDASIGTRSMAMGYNTTASENYSTALGVGTTASGVSSTAMGEYTQADGASSTAMGQNTTASGNNSTAMGAGTRAQAHTSLALGRYNVIAGDQTSWVATDPVLVVGNGTSPAARSNALTLRKNGDLAIAGRLATGNGTAMQVDEDAGFVVLGTPGVGAIPATGPGVRLMWWPKERAFRAGVVSGNQWDASNIGTASTAMGSNTIASGFVTTAMGQQTTASGHYSTAMGSFTTASGEYSTATGANTTASAYASLALGQYNVIEGSATSWVATDYLIVAGNGSSDASRWNALTLRKNGNLWVNGTFGQSDARLKEDVQPLTDVLPRLTGIRGVTFNWRDEQTHPAGQQVGLLAQEVQQAFPELVGEDSQGYLSVAYGKLTAVLLTAIQEQQREIEALRERVAALEVARAAQE